MDDKKIYVRENFSILDNLHEREDGGSILDLIQESLHIYSSTKKGRIPAILIRIDDEDTRGSGFVLDPYLTVYDGSTFNSAKNMVRVSLLGGNLLNHKNTGRKGHLGHLPANAEQLVYLRKFMNDISDLNEEDIVTVKNGNNSVMIPKVKMTVYDYIKGLADNENIKLNFNVLDICNFYSYNEMRSADKLRDYRR